MTRKLHTFRQLLDENEALRARFDEAEETLRAIQSGEVDALVVTTENGDQIFTLKGADHPFRVLIENMGEGALTITSDGLILYANRRFAEMLRFPLEKIIGSSLFDWIPPADREFIEPLLRNEDGRRRLAVMDLVGPCGTLIPTQFSLINLRLEDEFGNIGVVVTDLTEHKQIEAMVNAERIARIKMDESERSRSSLRSLLEDQKRIHEALRKSEQQLASELNAAEHLQYLSTQLIQVDNVENLYDKILNTAKEILRSDFASLQLFHPGRGKEGELHLLRHRNFPGDAARFWEWVTPLSRSTCGIVLNTRERVVVPDVRQCGFMSGSSELQAYLRCGILAVQTTPLLSRTGVLLGVFSTHWREPRELTESEIRCLDLLARQAADLIERMHAEKALAAAYEDLRIADQRKDDFLGVLSHEIRNPLASIMLSLSLLDRVGSGGAPTGKAMEIMKRQSAQLSRLVDDLLDVTRITRNKIELQKEQVSLNQLVLRTVEDYQALYEEKGVAIDVRPAFTRLYVEADPARLAQVVGNLLHNAFKYTDRGGYARIEISHDELQQYAVIRIEDNGIGMSPEVLKNVFIPFRQGDTPLDRNGTGGLGLGLALVKGLVELHGGTVNAQSDGPGSGSVLTVCLPLSTRPPSVQADKGALPLSWRARRVMVIEDIEDMAESLRTLLLEEGHQVMVAHDGPEGLARAKEFRPEVLLCDIGLPGMSGYQVARAFCGDDDLKNVYLVSLTGYARPGDRKKAREAGFHYQLAKPVQADELKKALDFGP